MSPSPAEPRDSIDTIYHVAREADWTQAQATGSYRVSSLETEGFIHLSTQEQVLESAQLYFKPASGPLWLLRVGLKELGEDLRWEPSRGGALFPHLYAELPIGAVVASAPLNRDHRGLFIWPQDWFD